MFGLLDYVFVKLRRPSSDLLIRSIIPLATPLQGGKTLVCFLPEIMLRERFLGNTILNSSQNVLAYKLPREIVQPNPTETRDLLQNAYEDALLRTAKINPDELIVLGISLGNCPAYRFAAETGAKNLISVVPGSRLAECIWESNATIQEVTEAKRRGYGLEDFQDKLHMFDPIKYAQQLRGHTEVHLGRFDLMIPYKRGKELVDSLETSRSSGDLSLRVNTYRFAGHSVTAHTFAREFKKRRL